MTPSARPPRAFSYVRVSTDEQTKSGLGLDAQREAIQRTADRLEMPLVAEFADEGVSGGCSFDKRLGLIRALDTLRKSDVLIVAKSDRLARDVMLSAWIEKEVTKRGARIVSAAGEGTENEDVNDPTSLLMRRIVAAFAEYERSLIRARTKAALAVKRKRGEKTGGDVPFGFRLARDRKTLLHHKREQAIIGRIRRMRDGGKTLRTIADALNKDGVKTKRGKHWMAQTVSNTLRD